MGTSPCNSRYQYFLKEFFPNQNSYLVNAYFWAVMSENIADADRLKRHGITSEQIDLAKHYIKLVDEIGGLPILNKYM